MGSFKMPTVLTRKTPIVLVNCCSNAHLSMGNTPVLFILMNLPLPKIIIYQTKYFLLRETNIRVEIKSCHLIAKLKKTWECGGDGFLLDSFRFFFSGLLFLDTRSHFFLGIRLGGFSLSFYIFLKIL